jgi:transporter family-2 protein
MFYLLAAVNGVIGALSRLVNAALGTYVGSLESSWINHVVGTAVAGGFLLLGWRTGVLQGGLAWYYWIGGCLGVGVVAASNYAVPRIGAVLLGMILLAVQLCTGAALDAIGALGGTPIPLTWTRGVGLLLLMAGALLVLTERGGRPKR